MQKSLWFVFGGILMVSTAHGAGDSPVARCQWKVGGEASEPAAVTVCPVLKDFSIPITPRDGVAKILSWRPAPQGAGLWLLKYASVSKGPQGAYRMERQVVVDVASKTVVGDALLRFVPAAGQAPKWVWSKEGVKVERLPPGEEAFEYKFPAQSSK